jgi:hypothetical protein
LSSGVVGVVQKYLAIMYPALLKPDKYSTFLIALFPIIFAAHAKNPV